MLLVLASMTDCIILQLHDLMEILQMVPACSSPSRHTNYTKCMLPHQVRSQASVVIDWFGCAAGDRILLDFVF